VFNPDRFLTPEGQEQGGQYPFGFGNHMCLGINLVWAEVSDE
jgi:cytochrome P450